jgi:single-stranded-DNA-specific exonuclease
MGMDVIVTDHHEPRPDGSLPDCLAISPTRHDSEYPCRFLCGAGVAYKLAQALAESVDCVFDPEDVLDLVALGTVADVVQLREENRSLVVQGLKRLQRTTRPGLLALFRAAAVDRDRIDPVSIGYYLAPRINAANRMASPQLAYDLITASDEDVAAHLATQLSTYNQQRQVLVAETFAQVAVEIGDPGRIAAEVMERRRPPMLIVVGDWPPGISGLLASKLVETYGLPAFVGSDGGDGIVSVSARSVPGVHVDEILEGCEASLPGGLFLGYGGHSGAAGFRVHQERFSLARRTLEDEALRQVRIDEIGAVLHIDAEVPLRALSLEAARRVRSLAPFGVGFPEPLFLAQGVTLTRRWQIADGKHARFTVQRGTSSIDGVYFNPDAPFLALPLESKLDLVFHVQLDEWNGLLKPELRLRDWRPA